MMQKLCVSCEVGNEFLNIIYEKFVLQSVNYNEF
jgi:hypothetical protein